MDTGVLDSVFGISVNIDFIMKYVAFEIQYIRKDGRKNSFLYHCMWLWKFIHKFFMCFVNK